MALLLSVRKEHGLTVWFIIVGSKPKKYTPLPVGLKLVVAGDGFPEPFAPCLDAISPWNGDVEGLIAPEEDPSLCFGMTI